MTTSNVKERRDAVSYVSADESAITQTMASPVVILSKPIPVLTPSTVMAAGHLSADFGIIQPRASSVIVPYSSSNPLADLDVGHLPTDTGIIQPRVSYVIVPCSSSNPSADSNPEQLESAIAVQDPACTHTTSEDTHEFPDFIVAISSPESAVISRLASRIKLIDGALAGVPKLASNREGSSRIDGSNLKQGLEPCLNPPLSL